MRLWHSKKATAVLELAILAPIPIMLMIAAVDFGLALLSHAQLSRAVASAAEYATLAGQNNVAFATIATATRALVAGTGTNGFLSSPAVTAIINNGAASGAQCCPGTTWVCSVAAGFTCANGATPGSYLTITASSTFTPLWATDSYLIGTVLTESVVVPLK
jgi:Flp pilus assembly protein TadG